MWRKDSEYRRGLGWLADQKITQINQKIAEKLTQKLKNGDQDQTRPPLTEKQRTAVVHSFVKQNWTGPVQTPIAEGEEEPHERKVFSSPDEYVAHLLKHGVLPWSDKQAKKKSE